MKRSIPIAAALVALGVSAWYGWLRVREMRAIERLGSDVEEERVEAARVLGAMRSWRSVPAILRAMKEHPDTEALLEPALERTLSARALEALEALLRDEDQDLRRLAVRALLLLGRDSVPVLCGALQGEESWGALDAMAQLGPSAKGAIDAIREGIRTGQSFETSRDQAFDLLIRIDPDAFRFMADLVGAPDGGAREAAESFFAFRIWWPHEEEFLPLAAAAVPRLEELLGDERHAVRRSAALILVDLGTETSPRQVAVLSQMLLDGDLEPGSIPPLKKSLPLFRPALVEFARRLPEFPLETRIVALGSLLAVGVERESLMGLLPGLEAALDHEDKSTRAAVAAAVIGLVPDHPRALDVLFRGLGDEQTVETCTSALKNLLPENEPYFSMLRDFLSTWTGLAVHFLGQLENVEAELLPAIIEAARSEVRSLHVPAFDALEKVALDAKCVPVLERLLDDPDGELRAWSVEALGKVGRTAPGVIPLLRKSLADEAFEVRALAAIALHSLGERSLPAQELLERCTSWDLFRAVARIGLEDEDVLSVRLGSENLSSMKVALEFIEEQGPAAHSKLPLIRQALMDPDAEIQEAALAAWCAAGGGVAEVLPQLRASIQPENNVLPYWLTYLKDPAVIPVLHEALNGRSYSLSREAAGVLGELGALAEPAVPGLIERLRRTAQALPVARALKAIGGPALPHLVRALDDLDPEVRTWVAIIIGALGAAAEPAVPRLARILEDDPDEIVRSTAVEALGRMGSHASTALPALEMHRQDSSPMVRSHVEWALGRIRSGAASQVPLVFLQTPRERPVYCVRHFTAPEPSHGLIQCTR